MRSNCRAISIVEVLLVVALIAILVAVLLPSIKNVRDHAMVVQCDANLRSLATAMEQYTTIDNRGVFPGLLPAYLERRRPPSRTRVWAVLNTISAYIDSPLPAIGALKPPRTFPWACPADRLYTPVYGIGYEFFPLRFMVDDAFPPRAVADMARDVTVRYEAGGDKYLDLLWTDLNETAH